MYSIYVIATLTGILYVILSELEQNIVKKKEFENNDETRKPFKRMAKNILLVSISSIIAFFIVHQTKKMLHIDKTPNVFINDPDF